MNRKQCDILKAIIENPNSSQRALAQMSGYSLGIVNRCIQQLREERYVDEDIRPTRKARLELREKAPLNAIILAAGFGMRMIPINMETPKGLLTVKGEVLIERIIRQLHEAGIWEIYIVVGFMKEKYEYLIDLFQVELIINPEYAEKNNLHSLKRAMPHLSNTYIIPCDIWCRYSPFNRHELYSWYMVGDISNTDSNVRVNRKQELLLIDHFDKGNVMIGISYLLKEQAELVRTRIDELCRNRNYDKDFWETALYSNKRLVVPARVVSVADFIEINTYEQLRAIDDNSDHLKSDAIEAIADVLKVEMNDITNITVLKKGMTNRSFLFVSHNQKYIMRIPGEGTEKLIDRKREAEVYNIISDKKICDDNLYMNPENGYRITRFIENSRVCNPTNREDVVKCMDKLRRFHQMNLTVSHEFNLFAQIEFYESLWNGEKSVYRDYQETKANVFSLRQYIETHADRKSLTHIDAVPDNFLFFTNEQGVEEVCLIDWEYAAMQDPHVDIAMFCIYSFYRKEQIDDLIQIYFEEACPFEIQVKIYCYIAVCGLLWSNWCEYKRILGVDFGEYSLRQYRYAKEYSRIVHDILGGESLK